MDNDGDQDIYTVIGGAMEGDIYGNMLFENPGFDNKWIILDLKGRKANRSAIGARVEIEVEINGERKTFYHRISSGGSFGANTLKLEAGLGNATSVHEIRIHWPVKPSEIQTIKNLEVNRKYRIVQGEEPETVPLNRLEWKTMEHQMHESH